MVIYSGEWFNRKRINQRDSKGMVPIQSSRVQRSDLEIFLHLRSRVCRGRSTPSQRQNRVVVKKAELIRVLFKGNLSGELHLRTVVVPTTFNFICVQSIGRGKNHGSPIRLMEGVSIG